LIGFFLLDGKHKWWILAASIFLIFISWGMYFKELNGPLLKILPGLNKFRAPSTAIVVPTMLLCILAALSLDKLFTLAPTDRTAAWKQTKKGLYLVGGIFLILFVLYGSFDYTGEAERGLQAQVANMQPQIQEYIRSFLHGLHADRQSMFLNSLFRSLLYIAIAAAVAFFWIKGKLKPLIALGIIGALSFVDLITIDNQYLSADKYVDIDEAETPFQPTPADVQVLKDTSYYRVFDLREGLGNITNTSATPYFHHDVTGYHPAKLSLYQDLIENQLYKYPNCQPVLDMLNTKYLLVPTNTGRDSAQLNPGALGEAWFVKGVRYVDSPRAAMNALTTLNVRDTAVLFTADKSKVGIDPPKPPDNPVRETPNFNPPVINETIFLQNNGNDEMIYKSATAQQRFAVFSEVYYNRGWHAYVDNVEAPIIRTDFALRGLTVPTGSHTIKFEFHPASYYTGRTIQIIASLLLLALLVMAAVQTFKPKPPQAAKP
ncbi:MAG TPA: hypothetical protein VNW04_05130, partial [Puia sp.]|nr:hypothetical protein [Puia sp.]